MYMHGNGIIDYSWFVFCLFIRNEKKYIGECYLGIYSIFTIAINVLIKMFYIYNVLIHVFDY